MDSDSFTKSKESLEEFFKNREINKIIEDGLWGDEIYKKLCYGGDIKNPQELNVKNSFDLLEYLKPCLVYIASDINTIKEEIKKEHADDLAMHQNYYFYITIDSLNNIDACYYIGFNIRDLKKNIFQRFFRW